MGGSSSHPWLLLSLLMAPALHVATYPSGAPAVSCDDLRPRHGSLTQQGSPSPYRLEAERQPGGDVTVRLTGNSGFRGLLLQARTSDNGTAPSPQGRFLPVDGLRFRPCGENSQGALTHTSSTNKPTPLELVWQPLSSSEGDNSSDVEFVATVVQQYDVWWEGLTTGSVQAKDSSQEDSSSQGDGSGSQEERTNTAAVPKAFASVEEAYAGCFSQYGCFGTPRSCVESGSCDVLVTYALADGGVRLALLASGQAKFAALGISNDKRMGSDAVIFCTNSDASPAVFYGRNTGYSSGFISEKNPEGMRDLQTWKKDGSFMCSFTQDTDLRVPGYPAKDLTQEHFLLVASGDLGRSGPRYHGSNRVASDDKASLTQYSAVPASGVPLLVKAHAITMTVVWVGLAGVGILSALYFRSTWEDRKICGTEAWFTIHRSVMLTVAVGTWIGVALIAAYLKKLSFQNDHNIVGFVVTVLTVVQVAGAAFRPGKESSLRPVFNWVHRVGGFSAFVLALTALWLALELPQPGLPPHWPWLLIAVIATDLVVTLVFLGIRHCIPSSSLHPETFNAEKSEDSGSPLRKILLLIYLCFSLGLAVAMVTTIVLSEPRD